MNQFNTIAGVVATVALGAFSIAATAATAATAAAPDADVPALSVKYNPRSLSTDQGAREVYHRLVMASESVCQAPAGEPRFVSEAVSEAIKTCRAQALARAVRQIDNSRLAAVYANSSKNG